MRSRSMLLAALASFHLSRAQNECPPIITVTEWKRPESNTGSDLTPGSRQHITKTEYVTNRRTTTYANGKIVVTAEEQGHLRFVDDAGSTVPGMQSTPIGVSRRTTASSPEAIHTTVTFVVMNLTSSSTGASASPQNLFNVSSASSVTSASSSTLVSSSTLLDIWTTFTPQITITPSASASLPCFTTPYTITYPPYTTSLCKTAECGTAVYKTMTTAQLPPVTMTEVCFKPFGARDVGDDGKFTPSRVHSGLSEARKILAPSGLIACPPKHLYPGTNGSCGPQNHYACKESECCGANGKCGRTWEHCDEGCQSNWGACWRNSTSCEPPGFENGEDVEIDVYPVYFDDPEPPQGWKDTWPPPVAVDIKSDEPCPLCTGVKDLVLPTLFGEEGECGIVSCDGFPGGWFKVPIPKLDCNPVLTWFCHNVLKCCCCGAGDTGENDNALDCPVAICDPKGGVSLDGFGKQCDPITEACDDETDDTDISSQDSSSAVNPKSTSKPMPAPEGGDSETSPTPTPSTGGEEGHCDPPMTVTDRSIFCELVTAADGRSTETCTSTKYGIRQGCTVQPRTTSVTTTACESATATHLTHACTVITGGTVLNRTASTTCRRSVSELVTGCTVSDRTTSEFTTECRTTTATAHTEWCFQHESTTISGRTVSPSATCTSSQRSVISGCDVTATTTSVVSTSQLLCMRGVPEHSITIEPIADETIFAGNSMTCPPPTRTDLPSGQLIVIGAPPITEPPAPAETGPAQIKPRGDDGSGETVSSGYTSCWYGSSVTVEVWPISTCGDLYCPNQIPVSSYPTVTPTTGTSVPSISGSCLPSPRTDLPACTPILVPGNNAVTEPTPAQLTTTALLNPRQESAARTGSLSCWCGEENTQEVWPQTVCGNEVCPNQATTSQAVTETAEPKTLPARSVNDHQQNNDIAARLISGIGSALNKVTEWFSGTI